MTSNALSVSLPNEVYLAFSSFFLPPLVSEIGLEEMIFFLTLLCTKIYELIPLFLSEIKVIEHFLIFCFFTIIGKITYKCI